MRILIIEDEPNVASFLRQGLEEEGHQAEVVYDGQLGRTMALNHDFDLVLLDLMIPFIPGLELCRMIKQKKPELPVLILTALGTTDDKVTGLETGADDYLVKPFEFKELLARIRVLTRRNVINTEPPKTIKHGTLELDLDRKELRRSGQRIELTPKEFTLMEFFMRNPERVLSRSEIAAKAWDIHFDTGTNVVDVYVNILRKKLEQDGGHSYIQTRVGMGYLFQPEVPQV